MKQVETGNILWLTFWRTPPDIQQFQTFIFILDNSTAKTLKRLARCFSTPLLSAHDSLLKRSFDREYKNFSQNPTSTLKKVSKLNFNLKVSLSILLFSFTGVYFQNFSVRVFHLFSGFFHGFVCSPSSHARGLYRLSIGIFLSHFYTVFWTFPNL